MTIATTSIDLHGASHGRDPTSSGSGRRLIARMAGRESGTTIRHGHRESVRRARGPDAVRRGQRAEPGHRRRHQHVVAELQDRGHPAEVGTVDTGHEDRAQQRRGGACGHADDGARDGGGHHGTGADADDRQALDDQQPEADDRLAARSPPQQRQRPDRGAEGDQRLHQPDGARTPPLVLRPERDAESERGRHREVEPGQRQHQGAGGRLVPQVAEPRATPRSTGSASARGSG